MSMQIFSTSVHHVIAFIRALKVLTRLDSCCFKSKFYRKDLIDDLKYMSSRHHIDDFMRGRIIGKIEEGRKITDVNLWKSFKTTGMCFVRSTTPYIYQQKGTGAPQLSRCNFKISFLLPQESNLPKKTVARRFYFPIDQTAPLPVAMVSEHHIGLNRTGESDESLSSRIWRESGTAALSSRKYPIYVCGPAFNGRTCFGTMTGYIDIFHVRLFRGAVGDKFVFMDDNATYHRTLAVQDCLDSEGIQRLVWPACFSDLNPIWMLWEASCWSKLSSDKQEHPHPCTHRGMG
ncbi:transposable element Tc1 transposase [Trichonephila clavipes]|nr:transposable element Tc1 transposase [Trichonephila clavipes]